jgi:hypothetical protein
MIKHCHIQLQLHSHIFAVRSGHRVHLHTMCNTARRYLHDIHTLSLDGSAIISNYNRVSPSNMAAGNIHLIKSFTIDGRRSIWNENTKRKIRNVEYETRIRNVEYDGRTSHRWSCPQRLWCRDPTHIIIINFPLEPMMWYKTRGMSGYANWTELMAGVTKQKTNFALKISTEFNLCYIITKHPEVFKLKTQRDHTRRSTEYRHFLLHFGKPIKAYEPKRRIFTNENLSSNRRNKARVPFNVLRSLSLKWPKISKLWMTWMFYWTA